MESTTARHQDAHLEVRGEGVWKAHAAGECCQHQIAQLNARRRDDVAEAQVVVAQELGEVVKQHKQSTEHALVQEAHRLQQGRPGNKRAQKSRESRQGRRDSKRATSTTRRALLLKATHV